MLEIVFGDSACGSLKVAQHYGEGEYQSGCMSVIVSHTDGSKPTKREVRAAKREAQEEARRAWESAASMGGNSADVFGFNLALSVGDVSESQPGALRRQVLERLYGAYPNGEGREAAREILKRAEDDLKTVQERAVAGESFRIWYSNQPDELCGLYWFMERLNQWQVQEGRIFLVKLPEWETDQQGNVVRKSGWGEAAPEEWSRHAALQVPVPPALMQYFASCWRELQDENAPLRAVLNGRLVSAPEHIYDDFILREIAAQPEKFQEAMLIGRVLGKYQLGIGDGWIAFRIEEMIRAGKLEVVSAANQDMPAYHRLLKKVCMGR